jgi:hypothetical protein
MTAAFLQVDDLLDAQARKLAGNMRAGYTHGFEYVLADSLIARWDEQQRESVLLELTSSRVLSLVTIDLDLDETDENSYETAAAVTGLLLAEIARQGNATDTLRALVLHEIIERRRYDSIVPHESSVSPDAMTVTYSEQGGDAA